MSADVAFVVVSYNGRELLRSCLESIFQYAGSHAFEVVVVDNASSDGSPEMVRVEFPGVVIVEAGHNLGFAAANNLGLARTSAPLVFLLNPDTEITSGCLDALTRVLDQRPDVAIAAPLLTNDDGSLQYSIRRFPTIRGQFAELLFLHRVAARLGVAVGEVDYVADHYARDLDAEWVTGAAMLVRRAAFERIGGFDEDFFLYSEEKDLCYRMREVGGRTTFVPESRVRHSGAGSGSSEWLFAELTKSRVLFWVKHRSAVGVVAYRVILAAEYGGRALGWYVRSVLRGGRARMRSRAISYLYGARAALTPMRRQPNWVNAGSDGE